MIRDFSAVSSIKGVLFALLVCTNIRVLFLAAGYRSGYQPAFRSCQTPVSVAWRCIKVDPDCASKMLKQYHQMLWSKRLPNGKEMLLEAGRPYDYLNAEDGLRLSSDTIVTSLMHFRMLTVLEEAAKCVNWKRWLETRGMLF